jgi:hypothetical protein
MHEWNHQREEKEMVREKRAGKEEEKYGKHSCTQTHGPGTTTSTGSIRCSDEEREVESVLHVMMADNYTFPLSLCETMTDTQAAHHCSTCAHQGEEELRSSGDSTRSTSSSSEQNHQMKGKNGRQETRSPYHRLHDASEGTKRIIHIKTLPLLLCSSS